MNLLAQGLGDVKPVETKALAAGNGGETVVDEAGNVHKTTTGIKDPLQLFISYINQDAMRSMYGAESSVYSRPSLLAVGPHGEDDIDRAIDEIFRTGGLEGLERLRKRVEKQLSRHKAKG